MGDGDLTISEFQEMIRKAYYHRDKQRGIDKTFMWFVEEVGELARAIKNKNIENIEEEIADVAAWLISLANLLNIDMRTAIIKKYGNSI
ncbi:MAG: MazG nucleotide pyrophosphohydrolase domain-containing protein [Candidatus Njordarchaeia archaeon]|mgnify:CR=1 FL=1